MKGIVFSNNMVEVRKSEIAGLGVFSKKEFQKGDVILKWHPERVLTEDDIMKVSEEEEHYINSLEDGTMVYMGIPERYVNHSCTPNTQAKNNCDIAITDIKKGEEITGDYTQESNSLTLQCTCTHCSK